MHFPGVFFENDISPVLRKVAMPMYLSGYGGSRRNEKYDLQRSACLFDECEGGRLPMREDRCAVIASRKQSVYGRVGRQILLALLMFIPDTRYNYDPGGGNSGHVRYFAPHRLHGLSALPRSDDEAATKGSSV